MIKAIFEEEDYKNIDFSTEELTEGEYDNCLFTNCKFNDTDLTNYSFIDCQFINCDLSNVTISHTLFRDVKFKDCKLLGLQFNTCNEFLFSATFDTCQLRLASFYKRNLKNCSFLNSQMDEVDFAEADLSKTSLHNCDLSHALFDGTNLEKADLSSSYNFTIDPDRNKITKAKFSSDQLIGLLQKHDIIVR